jgi:hypothetical protein
MSAIDRATAHFSLYKTRTIEVPEWGEGEGIVAPLIIYCPPITLAQKQRISNYTDSMGVMEALAQTLILLAKDEAGKPLFTIADKHALMHRTDPDVLARVVREMTRPRTVAEQEKN